MPQYADPDYVQGRQATAPCNGQSDKMVKAFEEQQTQQNTAFAQSMDAIERAAKSAHAAREVNIEESLLEITTKYDAEDQQRQGRWRRAEQEMRETSSSRENCRFETAQQQERTRHAISLAALEEFEVKARRRVAQLDDGLAATLEDLRGRVASAISAQKDNTPECEATYPLPSATFVSVWKRRHSWWGCTTDRDLDLPPLPEENDIQARVHIETSTSEYDGTAAHGAVSAEESACLSVTSSPPPKATNITQTLQDMQQVFEQAESARVQQYARMQRDIDKYDEGFDRLFAALQRQLNRNVVQFIDGFMKLEAEQPTLLAAGSAISAFKAAEVARNAMYVNSAARNAIYVNRMRFNTEEVKMISRMEHALKSLECRLAMAGLVRIECDDDVIPCSRIRLSRDSGRGYDPEVSGGSLLELSRNLFGRWSRPVISMPADRFTSTRDASLYEASHGARTATFEQVQAGRLHEAEDKEFRRQVQFAQTKRRITLDAMDREKKRLSVFQRALDDVRNAWRAREVTRAITFETTIAQLGGVFLDTQAAREREIGRGLQDMEEQVTSAIENAVCELRSVLKLLDEGKYVTLRPTGASGTVDRYVGKPALAVFGIPIWAD